MAYKCITQPELYLSQNNAVPVEAGQDLPTESSVEQEKDNEAPMAEVPIRKYQKSGLDNHSSEELYSRLVSFMAISKPYLDPDLTIYKLAEHLEVPRHHLSQVINEKAQKSFFDFVNYYRVEEVKRQLINPDLANRNILGISLDSGFNSKATFNAAFKKIAGTTPSAYQKRMIGTSSPRGPVDLA
jgi:AraC-like DNA-binding protein